MRRADDEILNNGRTGLSFQVESACLHLVESFCVNLAYPPGGVRLFTWHIYTVLQACGCAIQYVYQIVQVCLPSCASLLFTGLLQHVNLDTPRCLPDYESIFTSLHQLDYQAEPAFLPGYTEMFT